MASRLSSLLVRDGLVGVKRMENAFQRQVIYGGCLDTILLEMRLVPEPRLLQYLSLATGLPPATQEETDVIDIQAVESCPVELGRAFRVVPLGFEEGALRVLVHDPVELSLLEDLANEIECPVQPLVVPEYRFHMVFARTYGGIPNERFVALAERQDVDSDSAPVGRSRSVIVEVSDEQQEAVDTATAAPTPVEPGHTLARAPTETDRQQAIEQAQPEDVSIPPVDEPVRQTEVERARPAMAGGERRAFETANTEPVPPIEEIAAAASGRRTPARETILGVGLPGGSYAAYHELLQAHLQGQPTPGPSDPFAGDARAARAAEAGQRPAAVVVDPPLFSATPIAHSSIQVPPAAPAPAAAVLTTPAASGPAAAAPTTPAASDPAEALIATPLDAESASRLLADADDRDVIFGLLLRAIRNRSWYAGLLTIQGGAAIGRVAIAGQEIDRAAIVEVLIPLDAPSAFKNVVESAAPHVGPIATGEPEIDQMIERMGGVVPRTALLLPVVLRGRVVAIALGHERERDVDVSAIGELLPLAKLAADAILRVLARAKSSRAAPKPATREPSVQASASLPPPPVVTVKSAPAGKHAAAVPEPLAHEPTLPMPPARVAEHDAESAAPREDTEDTAPRESAESAAAYAQQDESAEDDAGAEISIEADEPATVDDLLDALESGDAELVAHARDALLARRDEIMDAVFQRFPGVLAIERYDLGGRLLPAAQHGPLLSFIVDLGESTVDHLVAQMASDERDVRYYATLCMAEIRSTKAVAALVERIFDSDYGARGAAVDALAGYPLELLDQGLKPARDALTDDDIDRVQAAARALADITDIKAIPDLMVAIARGGKYADHARRALMRLTKQDFGTSARKWRAWWTKYHDRSRIEWLIEGLAHKDDSIRRTSVEELRKLTGEFFDYQFDGSKRERETARKRWLAWWQGKGRQRFADE